MSKFAYSKLQHLADALFLNRNAKDVYFAIMTGYTSYSDAGGDGSGPVMTVAGFISNTEDWKRFDKEWAKVLAWAKVPYLHMNKFVAHIEPFANKKWERKELREEFIGRLLNVIRNNVDFFPFISLSMDIWKTVNFEYKMKEERLSPFAVTACGYVSIVEEWCRVKRVPWGQIEIIFEAGDDGGKGHFTHWCKKASNKTPIPKPGIQDENEEPSEYPLTPLQACDFAAWETRHAETGLSRDSSNYTFRRSFDELLLRLPVSNLNHQSWTIEGLRNLCATWRQETLDFSFPRPCLL